MRVYAFQGTRYGRQHASPGSWATPPYDQIDDALRDRLHQDPFSFAHLCRPWAGEGGDHHRRAADLHARWLAEGVIARDPETGLYPYEIRLTDGGRRLGLTALVGIEDRARGVIRPHERTVDKTVDERLRLTRTIQADLGPVLLLSEDGGRLDDRLAADIDGLAPVAETADMAGHTHRLFRLTEEAAVARYREMLAPCAGLIADGHHRYEVARLYARETSATGGSAAAAKLAVITSLTSPGLTIDPIHRALDRPPGLDAPIAAVTDRQTWDGRGGADFAAAVAAARQPAIGVLEVGQVPEVWRLDPAAGPADLPRAASDLAVVLLHDSLFPAWGLDSVAAVDGTVRYRSDPDELWRSVVTGSEAAAFFLPPMTAAGFAAAIADGDLLPPKSTRFLPKVLSGLVWSTHDAEVA